jgi:beta-xylosidase
VTAGRRLGAILVAVALAAAGCGGGSGGTGSAPAGSGSPAGTNGSGSAAPSGSGAPAGSAGSGTFTNPVLDRSFADPFVLEVDDRYYAYATGNLTYNIQVAMSDDLVEWTSPREALRNLPFWQPTSKGLTWAPEVVETSAGFVMHYTARDVQEGKQCLAVAVAEAPEGPFVDRSEGPLLCQYELGGSIDSHPFTDEDGTRWLLWKNDGNCCGMYTRIYAQQLSDDGLTVEGEVHDLGLRNDVPWERDLIEAPTLLLHDGTYYLFYSANGYNTRNYAVGYATSDTLLGPYTDAEENPILMTEAPVGSPPGAAAGPGHQSIVEDDDGDLWMVYHAWDVSRVGDQLGGTRSLWIDELIIEDGKARVEGPDAEPQPVP